jgi:hypothetical protein
VQVQLALVALGQPAERLRVAGHGGGKVGRFGWAVSRARGNGHLTPPTYGPSDSPGERLIDRRQAERGAISR